jgi:hypothetical protein
MPVSRKTRLAAIAASVAAFGAFGASPASAGLLVESAPDCTSPDSSSVFSPWGDYANYFLAPDGGLENRGAGWDLDGASVVDANSSHAVSGPGSRALSLPAGSAATTPVVCVGLEHPTMRFFVRKTSGTGLLPALNSLRVDVLVEDTLGLVSVLPAVGVVGGSSSWQPSGRMVVAANLLPLLPGSHTPVAFRFVPQGGNWQVDDVYVDPYAGR